MESLSKWTIATASRSMSMIIDAFHMLGDFESVLQDIKQGKVYFPDQIWADREVRAYAALGRITDIHKLVDDSLTGLANAGAPRVVLREAVEELRVHGFVEEAQNIAGKLADWAQKRMPTDPSEGQLRGLAARLYLAQQWDEAYEIYKRLAENHPESYFHIDYSARKGSLAARKGNFEEARKIDAELGLIDQPYMFGRPTYFRARIASLLGEKQQAVDLLHQAMREGFRFNINVIQDQDFLSLKDFPPFQEFIKPKG
jgi:tetratricopeptide (TPR) repeat protein